MAGEGVYFVTRGENIWFDAEFVEGIRAADEVLMSVGVNGAVGLAGKVSAQEDTHCRSSQ